MNRDVALRTWLWRHSTIGKSDWKDKNWRKRECTASRELLCFYKATGDAEPSSVVQLGDGAGHLSVYSADETACPYFGDGYNYFVGLGYAERGKGDPLLLILKFLDQATHRQWVEWFSSFATPEPFANIKQNFPTFEVESLEKAAECDSADEASSSDDDEMKELVADLVGGGGGAKDDIGANAQAQIEAAKKRLLKERLKRGETGSESAASPSGGSALKDKLAALKAKNKEAAAARYTKKEDDDMGGDGARYRGDESSMGSPSVEDAASTGARSRLQAALARKREAAAAGDVHIAGKLQDFQQRLDRDIDEETAETGSHSSGAASSSLGGGGGGGESAAEKRARLLAKAKEAKAKKLADFSAQTDESFPYPPPDAPGASRPEDVAAIKDLEERCADAVARAQAAEAEVKEVTQRTEDERDMLRDARERVQSLTAERDAAKERMERVEEEGRERLASVKDRLEEVIEEKAAAERESQEAVQRAAGLEEKVRAVEAAAGDSVAAVAALQARDAQSSDDLAALRARVDDLQAALAAKDAQLQADTAAAAQQAQVLQEALDASQTRGAEVDGELQAKVREAGLLQERLEEARAEAAKLAEGNDQVAALTAKVQEVTEERDRQQTAAEAADVALGKEREAVGALQAQVADLSAERGTMIAQVAELASERTALGAQVAGLTEEKSALTAQVSEMAGEKTTMQAEMETLRALQASGEGAEQELQATLVRLNEQVAASQARVVELEGQLAAEGLDREQLRARIAELEQQQVAGDAKLADDLSQLQREVEEKAQAVAAATAAQEQLRAQLAEARQDVTLQRTKSAESLAEAAQQAAEIADLKRDMTEEVEAARCDAAEQLAALQKLQQELDAAKRDAAEQLSTQQQQLDAAKALADDVSARNTTLEEELAAARAALEDEHQRSASPDAVPVPASPPPQATARLAELEDEVATLTAELASARDALAAAEACTQTATAETAATAQELEGARERLAASEEQVRGMQEQSGLAAGAQAQAVLKQLQDDLDAARAARDEKEREATQLAVELDKAKHREDAAKADASRASLHAHELQNESFGAGSAAAQDAVLRQVREERDAAKTRADELSERIPELIREKEAAESKLHSRERDSEQLNQQLAELRQMLPAISDVKEMVPSMADAAVTQLQDQIETLTREVDTLRGENADLRARNEALGAEKAEAEAQRASMAADLEDTAVKHATLAEEVQTLRRRSSVLDRGHTSGDDASSPRAGDDGPARPRARTIDDVVHDALAQLRDATVAKAHATLAGVGPAGSDGSRRLNIAATELDHMRCDAAAFEDPYHRDEVFAKITEVRELIREVDPSAVFDDELNNVFVEQHVKGTGAVSSPEDSWKEVAQRLMDEKNELVKENHALQVEGAEARQQQQQQQQQQGTRSRGGSTASAVAAQQKALGDEAAAKRIKELEARAVTLTDEIAELEEALRSERVKRDAMLADAERERDALLARLSDNAAPDRERAVAYQKLIRDRLAQHPNPRNEYSDEQLQRLQALVELTLADEPDELKAQADALKQACDELDSATDAWKEVARKLLADKKELQERVAALDGRGVAVSEVTAETLAQAPPAAGGADDRARALELLAGLRKVAEGDAFAQLSAEDQAEVERVLGIELSDEPVELQRQCAEIANAAALVRGALGADVADGIPQELLEQQETWKEVARRLLHEKKELQAALDDAHAAAEETDRTGLSASMRACIDEFGKDLDTLTGVEKAHKLQTVLKRVIVHENIAAHFTPKIIDDMTELAHVKVEEENAEEVYTDVQATLMAVADSELFLELPADVQAAIRAATERWKALYRAVLDDRNQLRTQVSLLQAATRAAAAEAGAGEGSGGGSGRGSRSGSRMMDPLSQSFREEMGLSETAGEGWKEVARRLLAEKKELTAEVDGLRVAVARLEDELASRPTPRSPPPAEEVELLLDEEASSVRRELSPEAAMSPEELQEGLAAIPDESLAQLSPATRDRLDAVLAKDLSDGDAHPEDQEVLLTLARELQEKGVDLPEELAAALEKSDTWKEVSRRLLQEKKGLEADLEESARRIAELRLHVDERSATIAALEAELLAKNTAALSRHSSMKSGSGPSRAGSLAKVRIEVPPKDGGDGDEDDDGTEERCARVEAEALAASLKAAADDGIPTSCIEALPAHQQQLLRVVADGEWRVAEDRAGQVQQADDLRALSAALQAADGLPEDMRDALAAAADDAADRATGWRAVANRLMQEKKVLEGQVAALQAQAAAQQGLGTRTMSVGQQSAASESPGAADDGSGAGAGAGGGLDGEAPLSRTASRANISHAGTLEEPKRHGSSLANERKGSAASRRQSQKSDVPPPSPSPSAVGGASHEAAVTRLEAEVTAARQARDDALAEVAALKAADSTADARDAALAQVAALSEQLAAASADADALAAAHAEVQALRGRIAALEQRDAASDAERASTVDTLRGQVACLQDALEGVKADQTLSDAEKAALVASLERAERAAAAPVSRVREEVLAMHAALRGVLAAEAAVEHMEVEQQADLEAATAAEVPAASEETGDALRGQHHACHKLVCEVVEDDAVITRVGDDLAATLRDLAALASDDPKLLKRQVSDLLEALAAVQESASATNLPPHLQRMLEEAKSGSVAASQGSRTGGVQRPVSLADDPVGQYHRLRDVVAQILASDESEHLAPSMRQALQELTGSGSIDEDDPDQLRDHIGNLLAHLAAVQESAEAKHLPKHLQQMLSNIKAGRSPGMSALAHTHKTAGSEGDAMEITLDDAAGFSEMKALVRDVLVEPPVGGLPDRLVARLAVLSGAADGIRASVVSLQDTLRGCAAVDDPHRLLECSVPAPDDVLGLWCMQKHLQRAAGTVHPTDAGLPDDVRRACQEAVAGIDWRDALHPSQPPARKRSMSVSVSLALEADYVQQALACVLDSPEATQLSDGLKARVAALVHAEAGSPVVQAELKEVAAELLEEQRLQSLPADVTAGLGGTQGTWQLLQKRHAKQLAVAELRADTAKAAAAKEQQLRGVDARQQALYGVLYTLPAQSIPVDKKKELQQAADADPRDVDPQLLTRLCEEVLANRISGRLAPREREALDTGVSYDLWKHLTRRLHTEKQSAEASNAKPPEEVEKRQLQDALTAWLVDPTSQEPDMLDLRAEVEAVVVESDVDPPLADLRRLAAAIKASPGYRNSPEEMERSLKQCDSWRELTADLISEKRQLEHALGRSRSNSMREAHHAVAALQEALKAVLVSPGMNVSPRLRDDIEALLVPLADDDDRSPQQLLYDLTVAAQTLSLEVGEITDFEAMQLKDAGGSWKSVSKQLYEEKKRVEEELDSLRAQHQHLLAELENRTQQTESLLDGEGGESPRGTAGDAPPGAWAEEKEGMEHTIAELGEKLHAAQAWEGIALRFEDEKKMLEKQIESLLRGDENLRKEHLRQLLGDVVRCGAADALPDSMRMHVERLVREGADLPTLLEALAAVRATPQVAAALPAELRERIAAAVAGDVPVPDAAASAAGGGEAEAARTDTQPPATPTHNRSAPVPPAARLLSEPRDLQGSIQQLLAAIAELEAGVGGDPIHDAATELRQALSRAAECADLPEDTRATLAALTQMPIPTDPAQAAAYLAELQEAAKAIEAETALPDALREELHRLAHDTSAVELQNQFIGLKSALLAALGITPTAELQSMLTPVRSPLLPDASPGQGGAAALSPPRPVQEQGTQVEPQRRDSMVDPPSAAASDASASGGRVIQAPSLDPTTAAMLDKAKFTDEIAEDRQHLLDALAVLFESADLPMELAKWVEEIVGTGNCRLPKPDMSHLSPPPKHSDMDSIADLHQLLKEKDRVIHGLEQELDNMSQVAASPAVGPTAMRRAPSATPMAGGGGAGGGGVYARATSLKNVLKEIMASGAADDLPPMLRGQVQGLLVRDLSAMSAEELYSTSGSLRAVGEAVLRHCNGSLPPHLLRWLVQATQQPPEPSNATDSRQPSTSSTTLDHAGQTYAPYDAWRGSSEPRPRAASLRPAARVADSKSQGGAQQQLAADAKRDPAAPARLAAFESAVRAVLDSSAAKDLTPALHYHLAALVGRGGGDPLGAPVAEMIGSVDEAAALRMRIGELEAKAGELEGHARRSDTLIDKMRQLAKLPGIPEDCRDIIRAAIAGDAAATAASFAVAAERETHQDGLLGTRSPSGNDLQTQVAELSSALSAVCGSAAFYHLPDTLRARIHALMNDDGADRGKQLLSERHSDLHGAVAALHGSPAADMLPDWLVRKMERLVHDAASGQTETLLRSIDRLETKIQRLEGSRGRADGLVDTMAALRGVGDALPDEGRRVIDDVLREDAAAAQQLRTQAEAAEAAAIRASVGESGAAALAALLRVVEGRLCGTDGNTTLLAEASSAASGLCSAAGVVGASMNAVASLTHDALSAVRSRGFDYAAGMIAQARSVAEAAASAAGVARGVAAGLSLAAGPNTPDVTPEDTDAFANRLYRDTKHLPPEATGPILQLTKDLRSACSVEDLRGDRLLRLARAAAAIAGHDASVVRRDPRALPMPSAAEGGMLPPLHTLHQQPPLETDLRVRREELRASGAPPLAIAAVDHVLRMMATGDIGVMWGLPQELAILAPPDRSGLPSLKTLPGQTNIPAKTPEVTPHTSVAHNHPAQRSPSIAPSGAPSAPSAFGPHAAGVRAPRGPQSNADSFDTSTTATAAEYDGDVVTRADSFNSIDLGVAKTLREALRNDSLPVDAKIALGDALEALQPPRGTENPPRVEPAAGTRAPSTPSVHLATPPAALASQGNAAGVAVLSDVAQGLLARGDVGEGGRGVLRDLANAADQRAARIASGILSLLRNGQLQAANPDAARVLRRGLQHADQLLRSVADVAMRSLATLQARSGSSTMLPALLAAVDGRLDAVAALAAAEVPADHPVRVALCDATTNAEGALEACLGMPHLSRTTARIVQEAVVAHRVPLPAADAHATAAAAALPSMHAAIPEAVRAAMAGGPAQTGALLASALSVGRPRVDVLESAVREACRSVGANAAGGSELLLLLGTPGRAEATPGRGASASARMSSVSSTVGRQGHTVLPEGAHVYDDIDATSTDPFDLGAPAVREGIASVLAAHGDEILPPLARKLAVLSGVMDPQPPPPTGALEFEEPKQRGVTQVVVIEAPGAGEWIACDVEAPLANSRFRVRVADLPPHHPAVRFSGKQLAVSDQHLRVVYAPVPKPALNSKVKRNPEAWPYGDIDGGPGKTGTVVDVSETNQITVVWDATRQRTRCRWGHERVFDVLVPVEAAGAGVGVDGRVRLKGSPQEGTVVGVAGGDFEVRWETSGRVSRHPWWEVEVLDPAVVAKPDESVRAGLRELLASIEGDTLTGLARMRLEALCGTEGSPIRKVSRDLHDLMGLIRPQPVPPTRSNTGITHATTDPPHAVSFVVAGDAFPKPLTPSSDPFRPHAEPSHVAYMSHSPPVHPAANSSADAPTGGDGVTDTVAYPAIHNVDSLADMPTPGPVAGPAGAAAPTPLPLPESFGEKVTHYDTRRASAASQQTGSTAGPCDAMAVAPPPPAVQDMQRWCAEAMGVVRDVSDGMGTARGQEFIHVPPELSQRIADFVAQPVPDVEEAVRGAGLRDDAAESPLRLGSVQRLHDLLVQPQSESSVLEALRDILDHRDLSLARQIRELAAPHGTRHTVPPDPPTPSGVTSADEMDGECALAIAPTISATSTVVGALMAVESVGTQSDVPAVEDKGVMADLTAPVLKKLDAEREKVRELQAELRSMAAAAALSAAGSGTVAPLPTSPRRASKPVLPTPALPKPFSTAVPGRVGTREDPDPQVKKDLKELSLLGKTAGVASAKGNDWIDSVVESTRADPAVRDILPDNFGRDANGSIRFGTRKIDLVSVNEFAAVRVGGGYMVFNEFVKRFADDERRKLVVNRDTQGDPVALVRQGRDMLFVDPAAERGEDPAPPRQPSPRPTRRVPAEDHARTAAKPAWRGESGGRLPKKTVAKVPLPAHAREGSLTRRPTGAGAKGVPAAPAFRRRSSAEPPAQYFGKAAPSLPAPAPPVEEEEDVAFDENLDSGDVFEMTSAADSEASEATRQKHMMEGTLEVLEARLNNILSDGPAHTSRGLTSPPRTAPPAAPTTSSSPYRTSSPSPAPRAPRGPQAHPWRDPSPPRTVASTSDSYVSLASPPTSARAGTTAHLGRVSRRTDEHGRTGYPIATHPIYGDTTVVDRYSYMQPLRSGRSDASGYRSSRPPPHPQ